MKVAFVILMTFFCQACFEKDSRSRVFEESSGLDAFKADYTALILSRRKMFADFNRFPPSSVEYADLLAREANSIYEVKKLEGRIPMLKADASEEERRALVFLLQRQAGNDSVMKELLAGLEAE